jgi:hypothetical protein
MEPTVFPVAVVMEWRRLQDRWGSETWQAQAVLPDPADATPGVRLLYQEANAMQYLVSGLSITLFRDDVEGYYVNWAAPQPRVFIMWRLQDGRAQPVLATVSYAEGVRFADAGEQVDGVPMPPLLHAWLGAFIEAQGGPPHTEAYRHG